MTPMEMLREFERVMGGPENVYAPDRDLLALRLRLIKEEYCEVRKEFKDAFLGRLDREALAKELADVLYVVYGTGVNFGIDLDLALAEVHRSNLSKLVDGRPILDEGGKVMKGPNYRPPDMSRAANTPLEGTVAGEH